VKFTLGILFCGLCSLTFADSIECDSSGLLNRSAVSIEKLPRFNISGSYETGITTAYDGTLLITAYYGRSNKMDKTNDKIFRYDPVNNQLSTLLEFKNASGILPAATLAQGVDKNVYYGITAQGGKHNYGTIYSINISSGAYQLLFEFDDTALCYPQLGLVRISDHELIGIYATGGEDFFRVPANEYNRYIENGRFFIFDLNTMKVAPFNEIEGATNALPCRINEETFVFLFREDMTKSGDYVFAQYSITKRKMTASTYVNYNFQPVSALIAGKNSSIYVMNYYTQARPGTYPFLKYDPATNKCSRCCKGSHHVTMYSSAFTSDTNGVMYGWFKMGPGTMPNGLLFEFDPAADSIRTFISWPDNTNEVNEETNQQLTPGYDFISNPVFSGKGKLYAISMYSGLVSVDMASRSVTRLVKL
jgi:uncharacterized repeat protein (TIGR03803 family)